MSSRLIIEKGNRFHRHLRLGIILSVITLILALFIRHHPFPEKKTVTIQDRMSLRHAAERNDVPLDALIPVLPPEARRNAVSLYRNIHSPIGSLPVDRSRLEQAVRTAQEQDFPSRDVLKYILWAIWISAAALLLAGYSRLSRIRFIWGVSTLTVFGVWLGSSPNPMEAVVRLHKLFRAIPGNPFVFVTINFLIFTLFSIFAAKLICGWGCPLGALQESLYQLPVFKRFKRKRKLPFAASLTARLTVYLLFLILFFQLLDIGQGGPGSLLYHHVNLFKIFDLKELAIFSLALLPLFGLAALSVYRPFCQLVCPFGLWAWILENIALRKVRKIDPAAACTNCGECERACPTFAMTAINRGGRKTFLPDCWLCGRCIEACKLNLIRFK